MPLSISDLRQFAGTDRMLLDRRSGTMQSVNKWQRFKSFFDIGDARQRNAETLVAIEHAFLNDPRFDGKCLQAELANLLGAVRTDRAIGAAQIRDILGAMDRLADSREGFDARVEAHVAARGMPDSLRGFERQILDYVKEDVFAGRRSPNFDFAARIRKTIDGLDAAFSHAGADADLRDVLAHGPAIDALLRGDDGTPAFRQSMLQRVDSFRAPVAHVVARSAAAPDPAAAKRAGLELLGLLGKPVDPAVIDVVAAHGARYSLAPLAALGPGSTKDDIVRAAIALGRDMSAREIDWPDGVQPPDPADHETHSALRRFALQSAVMSLPADVRRRVLEALESPEGHAAAQYVYIEGGRLQDHQNDINAIAWTAGILQGEAGRPVEYPGGFPRGRRLVSDPSGLGPMSRCAYAPALAFSGSALEDARDHGFLPDGFRNAPDPAAAFHAKVDAGVSSLLSVGFAAEMKRLAAGDFAAGAAPAGTEIVLPDGSRLPDDPAAARDAVARLVSGVPDAAYNNLEPDVRARANVLLALLSSSTDAALENGAQMSLNDDAAVFVTGRVADGSARTPRRTFRISGSPEDGFRVNVRLERPADEIAVETRGHARHYPLRPGEGSLDYEMEVRVDRAALDRAAGTDWAGLDLAAAGDALATPHAPRPGRVDEALQSVPDAFRFDFGAVAGFHFHGDDA